MRIARLKPLIMLRYFYCCFTFSGSVSKIWIILRDTVIFCSTCIGIYYLVGFYFQFINFIYSFIVYLRFFQTVRWMIWLRKIFQSVLCPTRHFQWKLFCTFNQHCLSYKISNRLQFSSSLFFWKLFETVETVLHWHSFFPRCPAH